MAQLLYSRTLGWTSEDCPYQLVQNFFGLSVVAVNCPPRSRWLSVASYVHPIHINHHHPLCFRKCISITSLGFPDSSLGKEPTCNAGDPSSIPGSRRSAEEGIGYPFQYFGASLVAQLAKNPPAIQETWVQSLSWNNPLEKGKATHSSILAWRIPWTVHRVAKSQIWLSKFHFHIHHIFNLQTIPWIIWWNRWFWSTERLGKLPKVKQLVSSRLRCELKSNSKFSPFTYGWPSAPPVCLLNSWVSNVSTHDIHFFLLTGSCSCFPLCLHEDAWGLVRLNDLPTSWDSLVPRG